MNYTPNDIQNLLFKKSLLGLNRYQVDDVLEKIVEDFSDFIRENTKLKEKLEDSQDKIKYYKTIEHNLQNSLVVAQQASEEVIANAKKNAENIIKEADLTAKQIIEDANHQLLTVRFEHERVKRDVETYRIRVESVIKGQLRSLQSLVDDENGEKT